MATLTTLNAASPLDASDDTRLSFTQDTTESLTRALDNVDTDFLTMNTLTFNVEYSLLNTPPGTGADQFDLSIRIINGGTILAAADSGGTAQTVATNVTNTTDTTSGATAFTYVNQTATKADWDGASVELTQTHSQTKGADGNNIQVDHVIFDGTYDGQIILTATQQSYTLTTQTANVTADRTIAAAQQSYTLTGQNAVLTKRDIVADQQSYTVTGQNAVLTKGYTLAATQASYTVTGPETALTTESLLYLRPNTDKSIGSWTDQVGGTTNIYTAIDEAAPANDSDYIKSETNPSASIYQADLTNPTGVPDTSGTHTVTYRYGKPSAGTQRIDITVRLREGAGTIASWTHTDVPVGWTQAVQTLSVGEIASITSYDNVYVEFEANQVV